MSCITHYALLLACALASVTAESAETVTEAQSWPEELISTEDARDQLKLLVILIDGLRWDAINTTHAPLEDNNSNNSPPEQDPESFFTSAQREGSTAAWTDPVFPTTAAPNLYTIATGLLPVNHGVLGPTTGPEGWALSSGATPLWETAATSGRSTALLRWTGCNESANVTCVPHVPLAGADNLLVQFMGDLALAGDLLTSQGYELVMVRTELILWASEHYGPEHIQVQKLLSELEIVIEDFFSELKQAGLWQQLSVVLLSPHGLTSTSPAAGVEAAPLQDCFHTLPTPPLFRYNSPGSAILAPAQGTTAQQIIEELEGCDSVPPSSADWFRRTELAETDVWPGGPEELLVVAWAGFALRDGRAGNRSLHSADGRLQLARGALPPARGLDQAGGSGYDTENPDMRGILIVKGPAIVRGSTVASVQQSDVYQLLCLLAAVTPRENIGEWEAVEQMLAPSAAADARGHSQTIALYITTLMLIHIVRN